MKTLPFGLFVYFVLTLATVAQTRYVDVSSASPTPPYTNWTTAARTIQDAIDSSAAGDLVLVTNGIYRTGGRVVYGSMTNRVAINKPVTVQSVNGAASTLIMGNQAPATTNGNTAVRCAFVANGAALVGFTLTNGATRTTGDAAREQSGGGVYCESASSLVSDCWLVGNSANNQGGGAAYGTFSNCTLSANFSPQSGGGAAHVKLINCTLTNNRAGKDGGGAYFGTLVSCTLASNFARNGGGAHSASLTNSVLLRNSASALGGGFYALTQGTLHNCALAGNSAGISGGGVYAGVLFNCTLTGNSAGFSGGGAQVANLNNCLIYYNSAPTNSNYQQGFFSFCCTTPLPSGGGNFDAEPLLAGPFQLSSGSPVRSAGRTNYAIGTDIESDAWGSPPSVGCDEPAPESATGPIRVAIRAAYTNVAVGIAVDFSADISGKITSSRWEWDDGTQLTNRPYASRKWDSPGEYSVVLRAYNVDQPEGVTATAQIRVVTSPTYYVAPYSLTPQFPYSSWETAANDIQTAVNAAIPGSVVLVSNGVYATGGIIFNGFATNRVAINKPLTVQSLSGPTNTFILGRQVPSTTNGASAIRCVYLGKDAALIGFSLTGGATLSSGEAIVDVSGGGAFCQASSSLISNCVIYANGAQMNAGGVYGGYLRNCTIALNRAKVATGGGAAASVIENSHIFDNSASEMGGGVYSGLLTNCDLRGNSASKGGGVSYSSCTNCTFTNNTARTYGGGAHYGTLDGCLLIGNTAASSGGGAYSALLNHCKVFSNSADTGGGAYAGYANTCVISGNVARKSGGGTELCGINNCTITGNTAELGGGARKGNITNSIVYYNTAPFSPNYDLSHVSYSCTTPLPDEGPGNFDAEPQLASATHLSPRSPAVSRGIPNAGNIQGSDVDGEPWSDPPSLGCDEPVPTQAEGDIQLAIDIPYTNISTDFPLDLRAIVAGRVVDTRWEFGDGTVFSNRPYASHQWTLPGDYVIVLRAYNNSHPEGVTTTITVHVAVPPTHYVSIDSRNPQPPYASWASAATNIQDAVDVASMPGSLILVSNGVYSTGTRDVAAFPNRLAITKPVRVGSVNGPALTAIVGAQAPNRTRCVYLTNGASLAGFTLTNGFCEYSTDLSRFSCGGGVWCESPSVIVSNCVLTGNFGSYGGAVFQGTLKNCTISSNSAYYGGGGAAFASLENCSIQSNYVSSYQSAGGGVYQSSLTACLLTGNFARQGGGASLASLRNCTIALNSAEEGAAASAAFLSDCIVVSNTASLRGGGVARGSATRCTLSRNSADSGGGAYDSVLSGCTLAANEARNGGGSCGGTLSKCELIGNFAIVQGGGSYAGSLSSCILSGNTANEGGGAYGSAMAGCALTGNAASQGGGVCMGKLVNCTITANTATNWVGGAHESALTNCIVYYNTAPNFDYSFLSHSCTTPLPTTGTNNFDLEPALANATHIALNSPCRGRGLAVLTNSVDIDSQSWGNPPSVGCDEPLALTTGEIQVAIAAPYLTFGVDFATEFKALISGQISDSRWEFDDGTIISNRLVVAHIWTNGGDFPVVLRAYNSDHPDGISSTLTVHLVSKPVYVSLGSRAPQFPFDSWSTAATNIQDAIETAVIGGLIIVSNGVYASGTRVVHGTLSNRVALTKPVTLKSLNGPVFTVIEGYQMPGVTNGDGAIRCAYVTNAAILSGFTLTNGATRAYGHGDYSKEQNGGGVWCEPGGTVTNCIIVGNSAGNYGGGAGQGSIVACVLRGNSAAIGGGGSFGSTLHSCALVENAAMEGGGAYLSTLHNCTLIRNSASSGGGAVNCAVTNSIVLYNRASKNANHLNCALAYSCTDPVPATSVGNFVAEPQMASESHISILSPCRQAGTINTLSLPDIDGNAWSNPPSVGCDEPDAAQASGSPAMAIHAPDTNFGINFRTDFATVIYGNVVASRWEFGDGTVISNRPFISHSWPVAGEYPVILRAYNAANPNGIATSIQVRVVDQPVYVSLDSPAPQPPYASWQTAARNIQDAIDAAVVGGTVLVSNGVYAVGARLVTGVLSNRIAVTKPLILRSLNGPAVTSIAGYKVPGTVNGESAIRCAYLANGATLDGFTVTGGATRADELYDLFKDLCAGGLWCEDTNVLVTNCVITGNFAYRHAAGAFRGNFTNCTFTENSAVQFGGGAYHALLQDCTLRGNLALDGGGAYESTLLGCTVVSNTAGHGAGACGGTLTNCVLRFNLARQGDPYYGTSGFGGAISFAVASNCTLERNSATWGGAAQAARLEACLIISNSALFLGGGSYEGFLHNCRVQGNSAGTGGGADQAWLTNCTVIWNSASDSGGGTHGGGLVNCTVFSNTGGYHSGGAHSSTLLNCILYNNSAQNEPNYSITYAAPTILNYCCTTPLPANGVANFTNAPLLVDLASGDLRLQADSPCINAGKNSYLLPTTDLAGNPRISGGTVDLGAYEYQNPSSTLSYAWLQQCGLPTDGSADLADTDNDTADNSHEWMAGTDPTDALSALRMLSVTNSPSGLVVVWASVTNRFYSLERATTLSSFSAVATNIAGLPTSTRFTDIEPPIAPAYYRVRIER
jgi:hypothetical protein